RIRHNPPAPHRGDEIVLAHDAVAVAHQVDEQIEHLRFDRNRRGTADELAPVDIKRVIGKKKLHDCPRYDIRKSPPRTRYGVETRVPLGRSPWQPSAFGYSPRRTKAGRKNSSPRRRCSMMTIRKKSGPAVAGSDRQRQNKIS